MRAKVLFAAIPLVFVGGGHSVAFEPSSLDPIVAILDTGVRISHEEFARCPGGAPLVAWKDFLGNEPLPVDANGHGTKVASKAVGLTLGSAPCSPFMVARVLNDDPVLGPLEQLAYTQEVFRRVADAIDWAVEGRATVISISLGGLLPGLTDPAAHAVARATAQGATVVVSAGNTLFPTELHAESHSPYALVVGGGEANGQPVISLPCIGLNCTNGLGLTYGTDPDVIAHASGVRVASHLADGAYSTASGTSVAAPAVAGMVAHLQRYASDASPARMELVIQATSRDGHWPYALEGHGFVDAATLQTARARVNDPDLAPDLANAAADAAAESVRAAWTAQLPLG